MFVLVRAEMIPSDCYELDGAPFFFLLSGRSHGDHNIIDCHEFIRLWLGDGKHLVAYLGKSHTTLSLQVFQIIFVTVMHCFINRMARISIKDRR